MGSFLCLTVISRLKTTRPKEINNASEDKDIPEHTRDNPEFFTVKLSSQQPGNKVKGRCQESGSDKTKEIDVHVDGTNPAKMYPFNVSHEIRSNEVSCPDHPR
jgi:hypothetical protein